ncbi:hypothetical protein L484_019022 [Morus notabilis]|uniref:Retrotransposon gag domain-containing protein n=1 Tax=Morus notabilis TaxID=981085 RepID=W9RGI6_9ROSA|nr:hypothetical protein L484_019022 [Morus notabilis]
MADLEKLEVSVDCFGGEALAWFQWEDGRRSIQCWTELKTLLFERFWPSQEETRRDLELRDLVVEIENADEIVAEIRHFDENEARSGNSYRCITG